jgi:hypothetical protein
MSNRVSLHYAYRARPSHAAMPKADKVRPPVTRARAWIACLLAGRNLAGSRSNSMAAMKAPARTGPMRSLLAPRNGLCLRPVDPLRVGASHRSSDRIGGRTAADRNSSATPIDPATPI